MTNSYNNYHTNYENVSHILNIFINDDLYYMERETIRSTIYEFINDKQINQKILGQNISIKWKVSNNNKSLLKFYTNVNGLLGDASVLKHTNLLLTDIRQIINKDKFSILVTKPITHEHQQLYYNVNSDL